MKLRRLARGAAIMAGLAMLCACDRMPGRPTTADRPINPSQISDFVTLYGENCAGCHGLHGRLGGALPINNPAYLAIVDDTSLRDAAANGISGTSMPAFAIGNGGMLTNEQIARIVRGIRVRWGGSQAAPRGTPPYRSDSAGDPIRGAKVFGDYCASCHGVSGTGGVAGAIGDPSFLALYSDQSLRTLVIAGRPDLGHPGWRDYAGKPPLDSAQISDLVAWFSAKRGSDTSRSGKGQDERQH